MLYFNVLSASLSGKYVNFGVFKLYGDKALDQVLDVFFSLMLAIPVEDIIVRSTSMFSALNFHQFVTSSLKANYLIPAQLLGFS